MKPPHHLIGLVFLLLFFIPPGFVWANVSAGVPTEPLWFSKDPFFAGDQITIFAPLYNSSPYPFTGKVILSDGKMIVGAQEFTLAPGGSSQVFLFPWEAVPGEHAFSIVVAGGKFISTEKNLLDLPIAKTTTNTVKRLVGTNKFLPPKTLVGLPNTENLFPNLFPDGIPTTQYLSTKIPASMTHQVLPVLGSIEKFRVSRGVHADAMVNLAQANIDSKNISGTVGDGGQLVAPASSGWETLTAGVESGGVFRTPWEYVKLFFVLCYQFFTTNAYAFYILLSYIVYRIIRTILGVL